jgi:DNA-directed RNA polymerase subunit RPC12/RpoP
MLNPVYDPLRRQSVVCDGCGKEISLASPVSEWSIFSVYCDRCGRYALESKFKLMPGTRCPRCGMHKLLVLKRFASTNQMRELIASQGFELYKFVKKGVVVQITPKPQT